MEDLESIFSFPVEDMRKLSDYMSNQMALGLLGKTSDLKMLPSYVTSLATGSLAICVIIDRR